MLTNAQLSEAAAVLANAARSNPIGRVSISNQAGVVIAYVLAPEAMSAGSVPIKLERRRPVDMPRHQRPKQKLSKRERVAAKHEKLGAPA